MRKTGPYANAHSNRTAGKPSKGRGGQKVRPIYSDGGLTACPEFTVPLSPGSQQENTFCDGYLQLQTPVVPLYQPEPAKMLFEATEATDKVDDDGLGDSWSSVGLRELGIQSQPNFDFSLKEMLRFGDR